MKKKKLSSLSILFKTSETIEKEVEKISSIKLGFNSNLYTYSYLLDAYHKPISKLVDSNE